MGRVVYTDQSGREHSVAVGPDHPVISIGRATECDIRSSKKSVSRHHAEVRFEDGTCRIVDLDSSNGTYVIVNGERQPVLSPEELGHNDEVWCGDFILYFYEDSHDKEAGGADDAFSSSAGSMGGAHGPGNDLPGPSGDLGRAFELSDAPEEESPLDRRAEAPEPPPDAVGDTGEPQDQVERLREEKQSVEDLASRQAQQIEELQEELEAARSQGDGEELERLREELEEVEEDNEYLRDENHRLADERDEARERADELEAELEEVRDDVSELEDRLDERSASLDEATEERDELERQVESMQREMEHLERQLERAEADAERADEASEQVQELKDEVQRRQDLIEDLEIENRKLRDQLEEKGERVDELEGQIEEAEADIDSLQARSEALERERDETRQEVESLEEQLEEFRGRAEDYEEEIQGLKQRLSLKRDEQKKAQRRRRRLEEENENLRDQLEALQNGEEGEGSMIPNTAMADNMLSEVRSRAEQLHRIVDAIKRTDFDELPTVDRIRLESAIRETAPEENLEELLELVGRNGEETAESEAE